MRQRTGQQPERYPVLAVGQFFYEGRLLRQDDLVGGAVVPKTCEERHGPRNCQRVARATCGIRGVPEAAARSE